MFKDVLQWENSLKVCIYPVIFCRPSIIHRRDFGCPDSCLGGLKTLRGWFWVIFISIEKFLGFLTTLFYSLKEAQQLFFLIWKTRSAYFETPCTQFQTCWDFMGRLNQNPKVRWKLVKGKSVKIERFCVWLKNGLIFSRLQPFSVKNGCRWYYKRI